MTRLDAPSPTRWLANDDERRGHEDGWNGALDKLARTVERTAPDPSEDLR